MAHPDDIRFHCERASTELERARSAVTAAAAEAHLTLSALHLEKMRALSGGPGSAPVHAH